MGSILLVVVITLLGVLVAETVTRMVRSDAPIETPPEPCKRHEWAYMPQDEWQLGCMKCGQKAGEE